MQNERGQTSPAQNKNRFNPNSTYSFGHPGIYENSISRTDGQVLPVRNFCQVRWFIYDLFSGFTCFMLRKCWSGTTPLVSPWNACPSPISPRVWRQLKKFTCEEWHPKKIFDCSSNFSALRLIRLSKLLGLRFLDKTILLVSHGTIFSGCITMTLPLGWW